MIKNILLAFFMLTACAHAADVTLPTTYQNGSTVTASNLNGNFTAITAQVNGGLDNDNANTTSGYHFYEVKSSLPAAGSQGRTVFQTSDNTLNLDNGSAWLATVTPSGTLGTGKIPIYNSGWGLLTPGAQYLSLVSNGASSLPSYQQVSLSNGVTGTLPGSALGTLSSISSGAGIVPIANLASGTPTGTKFLRDDGTLQILPILSNVLFSFSAATSNVSFVTNASLNISSTPTLYQYWTTQAGGNSNYVTIIPTKWTKIAGVSTVTIYCLIWQNGTNTAQCKVNIGTANGSVAGTGSQTTPEWKSFTIDVSGLTNGTTYDVTVQISNSVNNGQNIHLGAVIAFGS